MENTLGPAGRGHAHQRFHFRGWDTGHVTWDVGKETRDSQRRIWDEHIAQGLFANTSEPGTSEVTPDPIIFA